MGKVVSKVVGAVTGGGSGDKAAVEEAARARQVQEQTAANEKQYREAQANLQKNMQSLADPSGNTTATAIAGGTADSVSQEELKKRRLGTGLASAVGLNV